MELNIVREIDDLVPVRHVLMSVANKTNIDGFAEALIRAVPSVKLYSTGGTYQVLQTAIADREEGTLIPVSQYTGQPEMQGGLVKTLDFRIYLGLLSETYNADHKQDMARVHAIPIDMVVVNLYPFEDTIARREATAENARGNIDIGGPCMIRAAAKNFIRVASVTDLADYEYVVEEIRRTRGALSLQTRFMLAKKAFDHTARYDTAIASYLRTLSFDDVMAAYGTIHGGSDTL